MTRATTLWLLSLLTLLVACGGGKTDPAENSPGGSGHDLTPPTFQSPLSCAGTAALELTDHLLVGFAGDDSTATKPGFHIRYQYLAGGIPDEGPCASCGSCSDPDAWWGCWQDQSQPPGQFVTGFIARAEENGLIPMFTYYEILQASGVNEGTDEATVAAKDSSFMGRYFDDFRFFLQQIGQHRAFIHIEPDFWGYAEHANSNPHSLTASVSAASPDCGGIEQSIAGLGQCLIEMVRTYAPQAQVGLHASGWASGYDCVSNSEPSLDVAAEGQKVGTFLAECGAGDSDFVVVDISDRDAGYYAAQGRDAWLDATNETLPNFDQAFSWAQAVSNQIGRPLLWWQVPVGNTGLANRSNAWQDNRVEYFFAHLDEVAGAGAIGLAFGSGADGQTTPETDRGYLAACAAALDAAGGQPLCP